TINVSYTVQNQGTATVTNTWSDRFYLSADQTLDGADLLLGSEPISSQVPLGPGGTYTVSRTLTIPNAAPLGNLYLLFVADGSGQQRESNEGNNVAAVPLTVGAPDLTITATTAPGSAAVAQTVPVSWTVQNQGAYAALNDWFDRVYLSSDQTIDAG